MLPRDRRPSGPEVCHRPAAVWARPARDMFPGVGLERLSQGGKCSNREFLPRIHDFHRMGCGQPLVDGNESGIVQRIPRRPDINAARSR
jgi:hypothetical protein